MSKNKKIILIIWGFIISFVVIFLLILLLLKLQKFSETPIQTSIPQLSSQQQQENKEEPNQQPYNTLLKKIETEVDKLVKPKEDQQPNTLKYPPKTIYQKDGITPKSYEIYDSKGKLLKEIVYQSDGKTIYYIAEHDKDTNIMIKATNYQSDGKTIDYIEEYAPTGRRIQTTYYNPDGTIKEVQKRL